LLGARSGSNSPRKRNTTLQSGRTAALAVFLFAPHRMTRMADTVAKRIFVSWRATLIQELDASRKIDSNGALVGF
jgi:hypothetical protein